MLSSLIIASALAAPAIEEPLRTQASRPADAAVIIGIESYPFLPDVRYAERDANAAYQLMTYTLGLPADRVAHLRGGSREQILAAVRRAQSQVGEEGTLWVWFAGHGAASASGDLLMIGDDARPDPLVFEARSIAVSELHEGFDRPVNVILDSCWSGQSRDGEALLPDTRFAVPVWASSEAEGLRLWTAASETQLSGPYPAVRHGLFTYFAVGALRGWADGELDGQRDGVVTAAEAQAYVARMLPAVQVRNQTPRWQGPEDLELSAAKNLERPPAMDAFPPAVLPSAQRPVVAEVGGKVGLYPPLRYLGGGEYEDGARRRVTYDQLRSETMEFAPVQRVYASEKTWERVMASGWLTAGAGVLTGLVGLAVNAAQMNSYNWDNDRYLESVQRCERDAFFCPPDAKPTRPTTGVGPAIGAGITGAGAVLVISGALGKSATKRKVAKVTSEELRR